MLTVLFFKITNTQLSTHSQNINKILIRDIIGKIDKNSSQYPQHCKIK